MKNCFKKIFIVLCSIVLSIAVFSGCSLFEIDKVKYYNEVVITIGDDISFTKKDLIDAYNSYGYQYTKDSSSVETGVKSTATTMVERRLLIDEIKSMTDSSGNQLITLTQNDIKVIRKEAYEYMQSNIDSFEEEVRKDWDLTVTVNESDEEESIRAEYEAYEPTIDVEKTVVDGQVVYILSRVQDEDDIIDYELSEHFVQTITDENVSREAKLRYVKQLQDSAKSEGRNIAEQDVLNYEENRIISLLTDNKYLSKYQAYYLSTLGIDTDAVVEYFKQNYLEQKDLYSNDESLYHTAMGSDEKTLIYYHPNSGNEYIYVNHILLKFNDAQTEAISKLDKMLENDPSFTEEEYNKEIQKIINSTTCTFENVNGDTVTWSASQVYNYVTNYVNQGITLATRSKLFEDMVYTFNDDTGNMNNEFSYVVNLDTNVTDKMVTEFADAARALDISNGGEGAGSMTAEWIRTEYGLHLIFHGGNVVNYVNEDSINSVTFEDLLEMSVRPYGDKTVFHYIYDKLDLDSSAYNNKTTQLISDIKTRLKQNNIIISYYESRYKDLWD